MITPEPLKFCQFCKQQYNSDNKTHYQLCTSTQNQHPKPKIFIQQLQQIQKSQTSEFPRNDILLKKQSIPVYFPQQQQQQQQNQQQQQQEQQHNQKQQKCDLCCEPNQTYLEFKKKITEDHQKSMKQLKPIIVPQQPEKQFINHHQFSNPPNRINNRQFPNQTLMKKRQQDLNVDRMTDEELYEYFTQLDIENMKGYTPQQLQNCLISSESLKDSEQDCLICIQKFKKGEILTTLECVHCFHNECITQWLLVQKSCPICKIKVNVI